MESITSSSVVRCVIDSISFLAAFFPIPLSSMATIKLNGSICHFCHYIGKTVLWEFEEFEEFQNNFDIRWTHCISYTFFCSSQNNTMQFEGSILMCCCGVKQNKYYQAICKIWSVQVDRGHAPLVLMKFYAIQLLLLLHGCRQWMLSGSNQFLCIFGW